MVTHSQIKVEVVFANAVQQTLLPITLQAGSSVEAAIYQSGILEIYPEIDLTINKIGIFSKVVSLSTLLQDGDRVEIYRPLIIDPKEARRAKAQRKIALKRTAQ